MKISEGRESIELVVFGVSSGRDFALFSNGIHRPWIV